jgi:hypothetical protein
VINGLSETNGDRTHLRSGDAEARIRAASEAETRPAVQTRGNQKWRVAIVPAIIVLAIAGAVGVGFLGTKFYGQKELAVAPETFSDEQPVESASQTSKRRSPASEKALAESELPKQTAATRPVLRLRGTFQTIRPTQVYSGPSENSAMISSIGPGMKISVVDSRDGWLEIRSKHGRPPGFIRQEAAVKIDQN